MHRLRSLARRLPCHFEKRSHAHCDKNNKHCDKPPANLYISLHLQIFTFTLYKITLLILNCVRYPLDIVCIKIWVCMNCISLLNTNSFAQQSSITSLKEHLFRWNQMGTLMGLKFVFGSRWTSNQMTTYPSVNKRVAVVYKAMPAVPGDPRGHTEPLHIRTNVFLSSGNIINKI